VGKKKVFQFFIDTMDLIKDLKKRFILNWA